MSESIGGSPSGPNDTAHALRGGLDEIARRHGLLDVYGGVRPRAATPSEIDLRLPEPQG